MKRKRAKRNGKRRPKRNIKRHRGGRRPSTHGTMPQNDASATPPQPRQNGVQDTGQSAEDQSTTASASAHAGEGAPTEDKENGSSNDEGRSGGKQSGFWSKTESVLSIIASVVAIVGIIATFFQIRQAVDQFNAEGAVYRINYVDAPVMELSGEESGSYISYVVTNTGRTQGTILDIDRGLADERLAVCVPRMDDDGNLVAPGGDITWGDVVPVNHQFTLQPGQSRLVFMASAKTTPKLLTDGNGDMALTSGEPLTVTGGLRLYLSDGSAETVGPDTADPVVAAHYRNLAGYSQVLDYCARMATRQ